MSDTVQENTTDTTTTDTTTTNTTTDTTTTNTTTDTTADTTVIDINTILPVPNAQAEAPAPVITIEDLLNSFEVLKQKELNDKSILESIANMSHDDLKQRLLVWASSGFANLYEINRITIVPPAKCSDGVVRDLSTYIQFCSGKTIQEHVEALGVKVSGIHITFANFTSYIAILVSKIE